jgi:hypothetical protein
LRKFLLIGMLLTTLAAPDGAAGDQWTVGQVSTGPIGGNSGDWSSLLDVTRDGNSILFATTEKLTSDDTDATMDLYLRSGGTTTLMSPDFSSGSGNISDDGSTLVFQTNDRLVPADTDSSVDLYKRVGTITTLLSIGPNGEHGPCSASDFTFCNTFRAMSDDGQHVYFVSNAHLAPGDDEPVACRDDPGGGVQTYACHDIYENWNGVTRLVSGGPSDPRSAYDYDLTYLSYSNAYTARTDVSRDGRAFFQASDPLLPEDTDTAGDVYEWSNGTLSLATAAATGPARITGISDEGEHLFYSSGNRIWDHGDGGDVARTPVLTGFVGSIANSGDGSHVYFDTTLSFVPEDIDGGDDLYEQSDAGIKLITRGDTPPSPSIYTQFLGSSRDGSKTFVETTDVLVPYDEDGNDDDIYRFDSAIGTKRIVSTGPTDFSGTTFTPVWLSVSEDGSRAFFEMESPLTSNDTNTGNDIYEWNGDTSLATPGLSRGIGVNPHTFLTERFVNDAGTRVVFISDLRLRPSDTDDAQDVYETVLTTAEPPGEPGFFARPAGASPLRVPLVPTFQPCTAPNNRHGAPLTFGSCSPPTTTPSYLTVDTGGQGLSIGFVRFDVIPGIRNEYGDQADLRLYLALGSVSLRATQSDYYPGKIRATTTLRLTDRTVAGTVEDIPWSFDASCSPTDFDRAGANCEIGTSADALLPGSIPEGARAIWQLGTIQIEDGGADRNPSTNPGDNRVFASQGVFVP